MPFDVEAHSGDPVARELPEGTVSPQPQGGGPALK